MDLKALIRDIPDFPQPGVIFRDITTLLKEPKGLKYVIDSLALECEKLENTPDYIIGIESRGFIFAPALAYHLDAGFVPVRKKGKLPADVHSIEYQLEYGTDTLEIHQDAIPSGSKVMIVDDVIATGGTAKATSDLVQQIGSELVAFGFIVELTGLEGRKKLPDLPCISLVEY
ncbi:adenine phosphoribosyltransferase [Cyanobacterium aponinum AL20118]|uniref:Adenine phosphoribosyltransferase n=3 Tax=Cyanobacterium aponinum TaxID=379064 RepID=K9YZD2_CYAAP|nr:adenine phosphoribosyltransferase [Cyanobacterium aponinum]AFZ52264.1 adenine phosphoribosyltransferase [Cyanobacterium aponinum PCC 10605]MBD2393072.1 adenine phosphoribosyltransferase [Cyanobacterium aponinum FACHB-4101]MTF38091.1 adenine phosphoribosyltransferase [Cyanobacterium aponinum 0216]PHV61024.1 adenine phosphoribosyltransferase [Cyanobacterium aponinum IPPAS B-1201]WPF88801.1 adenine phosphoribosyltransferase [Cyanobacterium aponinum AL20115]